MKVLLGTDLLIYANDSNQDFGTIAWLFQWLDKLKIQKCIDFPSLAVLSHFSRINPALLRNCTTLRNIIRKTPLIQQAIDTTLNSITLKDTINKISINVIAAQLAFVEAGDVDFLISDNELLHQLSRNINLDDRIYYLSEFLDKCASENRELDQSKGLLVEECHLSNLNIEDEFFETFKRDYPEYEDWFKSKSNDFVFVSKRNDKIIALLKLKIEDEPCEYADIEPHFTKKKVLKISSFKIEPNRTKLAERFMRIIFNYAISHEVEIIYVTFFDNYERKHRLRRLFEKWGFNRWGNKVDSQELVLVRSFNKYVNYDFPPLSFPFHGPKRGVYLVYIDSVYANALLGSNQTNTLLHDIEPLKNSISKVLISYKIDHEIQTGSIILFVSDNKNKNSKEFVGVGIIDGIHLNITEETKFLRICRKRSIYTDNRLKQCWNRQSIDNQISTIEFLYVCPFNESTFKSEHIKKSSIDLRSLHRQELVQIDENQFNILIEGSNYEKDYIVY